VLTAVEVVKLSDRTTGEVEAAGNNNPDGNFRFRSRARRHRRGSFNFHATGLATGTYELAFTVSGDPTSHGSEVLFQVR
jgi:hypothetical protein